jgi:hypothetical protein
MMKLVLRAHVDGPHRELVRPSVACRVLPQPQVPGDSVQERFQLRAHELENGQNVPPGAKEALRVTLETLDDFARELSEPPSGARSALTGGVLL